MKKEPDVGTVMRRLIRKDAAEIFDKVDSMLEKEAPHASIKKAVGEILKRHFKAQATVFLPRVPTKAPLD